MAGKKRIRCHNCGHDWVEDLDELDPKTLVGYMGGDEQRKRYAVPCPECGEVNVVEDSDG